MSDRQSDRQRDQAEEEFYNRQLNEHLDRRYGGEPIDPDEDDCDD